MDLHSEASTQHTLQIWKSHQRADGRLAGALVVAASVTMLVFFCSPSPASAWVMVLFLVALGLSCLRLLSSTARVVSRRACVDRDSVAQAISGQILDVYERPNGSGPPIVRTTSPLWLSPSPRLSRSDSFTRRAR